MAACLCRAAIIAVIAGEIFVLNRGSLRAIRAILLTGC
jgi:hypothetical protein